MSKVQLLFPHQLFQDRNYDCKCYLVEEFLFFKQYNFHKQKLAFHRASMKYFEAFLIAKNVEVEYIESSNVLSDVRQLIPFFVKNGVTEIHYIDPTDNWLEQRIKKTAILENIALVEEASPLFLNTKEEIDVFFKDKKRLYQTDFYTNQRKKRNILVDENQKPIGEKWTFDTENRLKYPKGKTPPKIVFYPKNDFQKEAIEYVNNCFSDNYGKLSASINYPITHEDSEKWLDDFLQQRFREFGEYEDAIVEKEHFLNHSVLSPMLNVGLLTVQQIVEKSLRYAEERQIPMNSTEGFIRQIIGWREFIRAVYQLKGTQERTMNFWKFKRKIPASFWTGTTGIEPIDSTIKKVLETGYCHHIERLMILGNFMLLCEFDPDEVYRWFMEMFIDAYDWVMVPNVYGMSQFSDGGLMATKPYISGSNYLFKMSDFKKSATFGTSWEQIWDGLFWRFMDIHRDFFLKNPRLGMLVKMFDKMPEAKKIQHLTVADVFLKKMDE